MLCSPIPENVGVLCSPIPEKFLEVAFYANIQNIENLTVFIIRFLNKTYLINFRQLIKISIVLTNIGYRQKNTYQDKKYISRQTNTY